MKAIQISSTGGADVLILRDVPEPTPGAGEVLIRVEAAGVNFSDIMWRRANTQHRPASSADSAAPFFIRIGIA